MSHDLDPSGPELDLALLHRAILARSLGLRAYSHTGSPDLARSLRTLSQLGNALARHRSAGDSDQLPQFLLDAADRVHAWAASGKNWPPWETSDPYQPEPPAGP